jgi:hypothetical protein
MPGRNKEMRQRHRGVGFGEGHLELRVRCLLQVEEKHAEIRCLKRVLKHCH